MDLDKYFSGYNLKNAGREQKFGYAKNVQFKKLEIDLFHAHSALVESESIKRKSRLSE